MMNNRLKILDPKWPYMKKNFYYWPDGSVNEKFDQSKKFILLTPKEEVSAYFFFMRKDFQQSNFTNPKILREAEICSEISGEISPL